ncbi:MAG TPA: hemerythrin domain-containing protein [Geothrix sp.]|nr:hemerythrin domain-containing protein [Geothrix sp.]
MQLIEDLKREHELIEQVVGALRTFVAALASSQVDPEDGARFMAFFRDFAGTFHHDKEEAVLFRALVEKAEVPGNRGPVSALTGEHRHMGEMINTIGSLLEAPHRNPEEQAQLQSLARDYSHALWRHIDAENSVLFPEGQERLRRAHVYELPSRPMTELERQAREYGSALLAAYPPVHDAEALRGDGCMLCPSYGTSCEGLEVEWWSDQEWDENRQRISSD